MIRRLLIVCVIAGVGCSAGNVASNKDLCDQVAALDKARERLTLDEQTRLVEGLPQPKISTKNQRIDNAFITLWVVYMHPTAVDETDRDLAIRLMRAECTGNVDEAARLTTAIDAHAEEPDPTSTTR